MFFKKKNDPEARLKEAEGLYEKGVSYIKLGQYGQAEKDLLKCISILEPLSQQNESRTLQRKISRAYSMLSVLGLADRDEKRRKKAIEWARKSVAIDEELVKQGGTADMFDDLAASYANLGAATLDITLCDKALQIWMDLQKQYPNNPVYAKRVEDQQYNNRQLLLKMLS